MEKNKIEKKDDKYDERVWKEILNWFSTFVYPF